MPSPTLVVHGHFYQPPRENPWTEEVAPEPSAAPYANWNERITAESYRPNGWARILDDQGRILALVDNYEHLSFDVGPTLLSWLEAHAPDVHDRITAADRAGGGGMALAYNHVILPLANERDIRTQVRWGLADFRHRFGREAEGMWLPEAAVSDTVLAVLASEGVTFTILAPHQVRPLGGGALDPRRTYRWVAPGDSSRAVEIVVYDGALSHDIAFGREDQSAASLVERARAVAGEGGLVCVATDGETFGHHHPFSERVLAYALPVEAPRRGVEVTTAAQHLRAHPPEEEVAVSPSSWSCAHGLGRWSEDCGCSTGGPADANQRWRAPLRAALDLLRDVGAEVFERRGASVLGSAGPWAARDAYIDIVLGARSVEDFVAEHVVGDPTEALTLLEQQRQALLMYTSCGWFFWDLAGLETVQVLRYAARAMDLLAELGEEPPLEAFLDVLDGARSNVAAEGTGRSVWERHVAPARVDISRVVATLARADVFGQPWPDGVVGGFGVGAVRRRWTRRGDDILSTGTTTLVHRRTGRREVMSWAALVAGSAEPRGAVRTAEHDLSPLHQVLATGGEAGDLFAAIGKAVGPVVVLGLDRLLLPTRAPEGAVAAALADAVTGAVDGEAGALATAVALVPAASALGANHAVERAQERVYRAMVGGARADLEPLGTALGLAVERLGLPAPETPL